MAFAACIVAVTSIFGSHLDLLIQQHIHMDVRYFQISVVEAQVRQGLGIDIFTLFPYINKGENIFNLINMSASLFSSEKLSQDRITE